MTGPHEEDCKAGMSGSQLVSGGRNRREGRPGRRGAAGEERGGQGGEGRPGHSVGVGARGLPSWRPAEEEVNRCPQAGRLARSGRAGGHLGAQWGCRVTVKPSRTLQTPARVTRSSHCNSQLRVVYVAVHHSFI